MSSALDPSGAPTTHHDQPHRRLVVPLDLVTDQALLDAGGDQFHHTAIAKAVADLTLSTAAPVNIALFGPWGSGKSTFYNLMKSRIEQQDQRTTVAYYDAWKYGGQALKRNFIQEVAGQLQIKRTSDLDRDLTLNQEQSRIRLSRWVRYNWMSLLGAAMAGAVVAAIWASTHAAVEARWIHPSNTFREMLPSHVSEFGLVLAAVLTALLLGPKALESAVVKTTRPAAERDDQFARMFTKLVGRIKKQTGAHRLVFFIDELDRCNPDDVVATLVDLKTFLDEEGCVFVVAADRDVLEHALRKVPQAKPIRDEDPYYSTPGAFIDKIFQHQISLPPLRAHALSSFAHKLVSDRPSGLWHDLREADPSGRLFDDVVYILVPAHVSSPRRVKVLLNNFATSARIAESRHIDWVNRARELAFLTVLETEFPTVAAALIRFPELLTYLRKDKDPLDPALTPNRKNQIDRLLTTTSSSESVAGKIVREDDDTDDLREQRAQQELARQLNDYLGKLAVITGLHDPRPDLFYLRVAGYDEGMTDPALGEMIDLAAERQPTALLAAFADQTTEMKAVAARLLIKSLASQRGTGQANVLESACRLVQQLPRRDVEALGHLTPEVMTHIGQSTWRPEALPGVLFLTATQSGSEAQVDALMHLVDPSTPTGASLLASCVPALEWMDDTSASRVHAKIGGSLATTTPVLTLALSRLPAAQATRAWDDVQDSLETRYPALAPVEAVELFDNLVTAGLDSHDQDELVWEVLVQALGTKIPLVLQRIYERRQELMPVLSPEHEACVALYALELSSPTTWTDWASHLSDIDVPSTETVSKWARDAALIVAGQLSTSTNSLPETFTPVVRLFHDSERQEVCEALSQQAANIKWADTADPDGTRWANLWAMADAVTATEEERTRLAETVTDSLAASVATQLPALTTANPLTAYFTDWCGRIAELPRAQAKKVDSHLANLTGPNTAATVLLLRLRIAARHKAHLAALPPRALTPVAGEPLAGVMAGEWLALRPSVDNVISVVHNIAVGTGPLSKYAAALSPEDRTKLWLAFESGHASPQHLQAVGNAGIRGEAIAHMADRILRSSQQKQRDLATDRLLLSPFHEVPSRAEAERGAVRGHKEASQLAVDLVGTQVKDNMILAARLVIHSDGVAHRSRGRLRDAFTNFANGKQSRNFTSAQATQLQQMGLLAARKKGRWARLFAA